MILNQWSYCFNICGYYRVQGVSNMSSNRSPFANLPSLFWILTEKCDSIKKKGKQVEKLAFTSKHLCDDYSKNYQMHVPLLVLVGASL